MTKRVSLDPRHHGRVGILGQIHWGHTWLVVLSAPSHSLLGNSKEPKKKKRKRGKEEKRREFTFEGLKKEPKKRRRRRK